MKLQRFKKENNKQKSIIIFTITCVLLITGVFLYKSFANFQVVENEDLINGSIEDPGDIYFAFYKDNKIQKEMPKKSDGYVLDEESSYCGVTGRSDSNIKVSISEDETIQVHGVTTSRTKCNLYFVKGAYILGKGIPLAPEGEDGLYEVKHDGITGTVNDTGFQQTEYRYAGSDPNNYIKFNDELWRIIGLVNVMTDESHVEQRVKIVRNNALSSIAYCTYDTSNDWNEASLMKLLNEGEYYTRTGAYVSNGLLDAAKSMIEKVYWNLGAWDSPLTTSSSELYIHERWNKTAKICANPSCSGWNNAYFDGTTLWNGLIALKYGTDYFYAFGGEKRNECLNKAINNLNPEKECLDFNWSITLNAEGTFEYLLSPTRIIYGYAFVEELRLDSGCISDAYHNVSFAGDAKPTLYLKNNVKIKYNEKDGSLNAPYDLQQIL